MNRLLIAWASGIAAMALELVVMVGLPAAMPGHSLLNDYISTAGATDSPDPLAFSIIGITAALLHLVLVAGLWRQGSGRLHRWATGLFGAFFALLGVGLAFQCDPGCELDTVEAWTHFWFGVIAFVCLGVAGLLVAWMSWKGRDTPLLALSLGLAVIDILLLLSDQTRFLRGLTERLTLSTMMAWSVLWMLRLSAPDAPGNPSTPST